ncbi:NTP transferase domain-containing protein [Rubellimicrobium roseum]|uniref:MobA-like NTP transferase domain-containing protein n=1 Tax=Rubellimicrobium roseum TaxID=687525 RepID=A0A5C4N6R7_9RHOB|nr:hypothetical protein FHG71_16295 [Rubellimicrobium roseum]
MSASLRRGLKSLPSSSRGVVALLADMPLAPAQAATPLLEALDRDATAAESRLGEHPEHRVAFARDLYSEVTVLQGDQGRRAHLRSHAEIVRLITSDPGAVLGSIDDRTWRL